MTHWFYQYQTRHRAIMLVINHNNHRSRTVCTGYSRVSRIVVPTYLRVTGDDNGGNNSSWSNPGNDSALFYNGNKCQSIAFVGRDGYALPSSARVPFAASFVAAEHTVWVGHTAFRALMRSICRTACVRRKRRKEGEEEEGGGGPSSTS